MLDSISTTKYLTCWIWILKRRQWFPILEDRKKNLQYGLKCPKWGDNLRYSKAFQEKGMIATPARRDYPNKNQRSLINKSARIPKRMQLFSWLASLNGSFESIQIIESVENTSHLWYCWWFRNPGSTHQLRLVDDPIIYKVLSTIPGGWPWDFFHQQYHSSYTQKVNSSHCIRSP